MDPGTRYISYSQFKSVIKKYYNKYGIDTVMKTISSYKEEHMLITEYSNKRIQVILINKDKTMKRFEFYAL